MKKIYNKNLYQNFKSDYSPDDFHHIAFKTTNYEKKKITEISAQNKLFEFKKKCKKFKNFFKI